MSYFHCKSCAYESDDYVDFWRHGCPIAFKFQFCLIAFTVERAKIVHEPAPEEEEIEYPIANKQVYLFGRYRRGSKEREKWRIA